MARHLSWALVILLPASTPALAQGRPIIDRIQIRHNLETKKEVAQPAFFQMTLPKDGEETFAIGLGVKVDAFSRSGLDVGPFGEYLRNTQIDKEQNTLRLGVASEWQFMELGKKRASSSPILLNQVNYKRDGVKETDGVQASLLYTHAFRKEDALLPNSTLIVGDFFDLIYSPYLGLEYEHTSSGDASANDVLRGVFRIEIALYPAAQLIQRRLQFGITYAIRHDLAESLADESDSHPLIGVDVNLFLFQDEEKQRQAGIGVTYVNGVDPLKGLSDQEYAQLGFKLQI